MTDIPRLIIAGRRRVLAVDMLDIDAYLCETAYAPPADDALDITVSDDAPGVVYAPARERFFFQGATWQTK